MPIRMQLENYEVLEKQHGVLKQMLELKKQGQDWLSPLDFLYASSSIFPYAVEDDFASWMEDLFANKMLTKSNRTADNSNIYSADNNSESAFISQKLLRQSRNEYLIYLNNQSAFKASQTTIRLAENQIIFNETSKGLNQKIYELNSKLKDLSKLTTIVIIIQSLIFIFQAVKMQEQNQIARKSNCIAIQQGNSTQSVNVLLDSSLYNLLYKTDTVYIKNYPNNFNGRKTNKNPQH